MYMNYVVWSTMLVTKAVEMVAKAPIVVSNHYWCLNNDYWGLHSSNVHTHTCMCADAHTQMHAPHTCAHTQTY